MSKGEIKDRYQAVAVAHNINPGDPDAGKAPQVEVEMRGLEHQAGKKFYLYLSLKEGKAQEITAETLRNLGWTCNDITALEGLGSTKVQIVEKVEVYNGKARPRYDVWPLKARASLRSEDQESFARQFKALAAAVKPVEKTELNTAPAEIPEAIVRGNGAGTTETGDSDPSMLY